MKLLPPENITMSDHVHGTLHHVLTLSLKRGGDLEAVMLGGGVIACGSKVAGFRLAV